MGLISLVSNLLTKLTPREHEVAELLLQGCDQAEIAKELKMARRTVKAYLNKMYVRASLSDFTGIKRVQLAVMLHRERQETRTEKPFIKEELC
jgi:DNA-binding NarL/FixJ family response regulator